MSRWIVLGLVALSSAAIAGFAMFSNSSAAAAATSHVTLGAYFFNPANITVNVGDTVTWTNMDFSNDFYGPTPHTTTSNTGLWSSGDMAPNSSFSFTFNSPGVFAYNCVYHSYLGMVGTITVAGAATTPTLAPTLPPLSTPTPVPTLTGGAVGGRGFSLSTGSVDLSWIGGAAQTGFSILRLSLTSGVTTLPSAGGLLPASATSYGDTSNLPDPAYCYAVLPMGPSGPLGRSDALCLLTNSSSGTVIPTQFGIQLNQSTMATLRWIPASGATQPTLVAVPLNGAPIRTTPLSVSQTTVTDETGGVPTCYAVFTASGHTPILCGLPGFSTL